MPWTAAPRIGGGVVGGGEAAGARLANVPARQGQCWAGAGWLAHGTCRDSLDGWAWLGAFLLGGRGRNGCPRLR